MKQLILALITLAGFGQINAQNTVYQFSMLDIHGEEISLSEYRGKVILIVNVASKCGKTSQYEGLQTLYEQYQDHGLVILGFPANNFLGQEPGSDEEIYTFCTSKYQVTFPMFSKISVKGKNIHPLYTYLTEIEVNGFLDAPVTWNFQKFLIDREGQIVTSFKPGASVDEEPVRAVILSELSK